MSDATVGLKQAFEQDPENTRAFEALEEKHFLNANWEGLVALYRTRLTAPTLQADAKLAAAQHFRMAQILEERVGDAARAIEAYWAVAQLQPDHHRALRQLRRIHARQLEWEIVLEIAEIEAQTPMPDHERASALAELGELWRVELDDVEKAIEAFDKALALDPDQIDALTGLARTHAARDRVAEAADLWEKVVERQRGPDRAAALIELARLLAGPLDEPERATECYRRALTDEPRNTVAVEALVESAQNAGQWDLLADLLERRFSLAAGARRRTDIAIGGSELHLVHLDNPSHARHWLDRARELSPDDPRVHEAAAKIERRAGNQPGVLAALEESIRLASDPSLEVLLEAAALNHELDNDERALSQLRRALIKAPDDPAVAEELDLCLTRLCRDSERVDVLERRVALADSPATQAKLLCEIARLYRDVIEDEAAAASVWSRAFDADPSHTESSQEWIAQLRKTEQWDTLRAALERAANEGEDDARAQHLQALGELALVRFEDAEGAAVAYEQALELDPTAQRALEGLAQIAASSGDEDAIRRAYAREAEVTSDRQRLATLVWELVRIHEARQEWNDALAWLTRLRSAAPDDVACLEAIVRQFDQLQIEAPGERADDHIAALSALERISSGEPQARARKTLAQLHQASGRNEEAIQWLEASLESDPNQVDATRQLVDHYTRENRHELRARYQRRLADLLPPDERAECMASLAQLLEEQLGDLDGAIVILWQLSSEAQCRDETREHLTTLLERAGRYEELAQHLLEQRRALGNLDATSDDAQRRAARAIEMRRADLLIEPLGRFEEAALAFRALHESDPSCSTAFEGLERALRADHDTVGLAELLKERADDAERSGNLAGARRFQFERAVLLDDADSGKPAATLAAYTALADQRDDMPVAREAAARLESLLERTGDWGTLRQRLEQRVGASTANESTPEVLLTLHERLAGLCRDRLSDNAGGIEHLEAAGRLAPERASTWQGLALLYDTARRPNDLLRVIEAELACDVEPNRARDLHARAARLAAANASDNDAARRHYEALLSFDPGHAEASEFLIDYYSAAGQHDRLAELLAARIELTGASTADAALARSQRTSLRLRLAELQSASLDDTDAAIDTLRAAYREEGAVATVAAPFADLLQRAGQLDELIDVCEATCSGVLPDAEQSSWRLRQADALRAAQRPEESLEAYERIEDAAPESAAAKAALRQLYRELDRSEPLAALLVEQLYATPCAEADEGRDALKIHFELAELFAGPLERPADALTHYDRVLALAPGHRIARNHAIEVAAASELHEPLAELLGGALAHAATPDERAELLVQRGQLFAGALGRDDEAISNLREALGTNPNHLSARKSLREVYERAGRWSAALDCLFVEARLAEPEERRALLDRGVELSGEHLSIDATLPWLERLRAEDPNDATTFGRIADVHRQAGRPEALLRTLEHQIALSEPGEGRQQLHCDRARVLERDLRSPGRALAEYEAALAAAPGDATVLGELARLRGSLGRIRSQVDAIEALAAISSGAECLDLHHEAATLCIDELRDRVRARDHLEAALAIPDCTGARRSQLLAALGDTLEADGLIGRWVEVAELELPLHEADADRAIELRERLAKRYEHDLASLERALRHASALAEWAAKSDSTCTADRRDEIEQTLIRLHSRLRNPIALEGQLADWLERHPDDLLRALELARLRDEVLHSASSAADAYRLASVADPDSLEALRGFRNCSARIGDWNEVADALGREVELTTNSAPPERTALLRSLGDITWQHLDDTERARSAYEGALEIEPEDLIALRALQTLREACAEHEAALELYERECEILGEAEPERRTAAWLRAGELSRDYTNDAPRALAAYKSAAQASELSARHELEWAELLLACGETKRHAEVFGSWCDRSDSPARAQDHLRLADHLTDLAEPEAALDRTRRATQADAKCRDAWDALARRCGEAGLISETAEAFESAAGVSVGTEAATRYVSAGLAVETEDAERALAWLRQGVESDSAHAAAHAHRARLAERCDHLEEAEEAAGLALQAQSETTPTTTNETQSESEACNPSTETGSEGRSATRVDAALRLETALVGARIAKGREAWDTAALFCGAALEVDADCAEALASAGEVLYALGDIPGARELLEQRLSLSETDDALAAHLCMIADGLELAGSDGDAAEKFSAAVDADPTSAKAHAGAVRTLERLGRTRDAIAALERWAGESSEASERSDALLRAGQLEIGEGLHDDAEAHLRLALEENSENAAAWLGLCELYVSTERAEDALEAAEGGAETVAEHGDAEQRAHLDRMRAGLLEARGDIDAAAAAWSRVARAAPRDSLAALAQARLHRGEGNWQEAACALASFLEAHPDPAALELAQVHEEHARLLAGPLEEVEDAIVAYQRALELDPERAEARAKLASLLAMLPGRRGEAVNEHKELLRRDPTATSSLRSLIRIAQAEGAESTARTGLTILAAIGIATPEERSDASSSLRAPIARDAVLSDPHQEQLRCAVREAGDVFSALADSLGSAPATKGHAHEFSIAIDDVQLELVAPRILDLDDRNLGDALFGLVALAIEPTHKHAESDAAVALDRAIGRRGLRRIRKHLEHARLDDLVAIDPAAWRAEVRALAGSVAVDRQGGDLRAALVALIGESRPDAQPGSDAELSPLLETCHPAQLLLARVVTAWCDRIAREI